MAVRSSTRTSLVVWWDISQVGSGRNTALAYRLAKRHAQNGRHRTG